MLGYSRGQLLTWIFGGHFTTQKITLSRLGYRPEAKNLAGLRGTKEKAVVSQGRREKERGQERELGEKSEAFTGSAGDFMDGTPALICHLWPRKVSLYPESGLYPNSQDLSETVPQLPQKSFAHHPSLVPYSSCLGLSPEPETEVKLLGRLGGCWKEACGQLLCWSWTSKVDSREEHSRILCRLRMNKAHYSV